MEIDNFWRWIYQDLDLAGKEDVPEEHREVVIARKKEFEARMWLYFDREAFLKNFPIVERLKVEKANRLPRTAPGRERAILRFVDLCVGL